MRNRTTVSFAMAVALLLAATNLAAAQGGGGGAGGAGAGAGGTGQTGAGAGGTGQSSVGTRAGPSQFSDPLNRGRQDTQSDFNTTSGSGSPNQPRPGVGTAPNGLPIGSTGSGPGSPEQPHNSGSSR
jgi:hypothetical protein